MGFCLTNGSLNLGQTTRFYNYRQKKRVCKIVDFAVLADLRVKLKESEKKNKYLDLAWKLKKLWNMKVMVILVISLLDTVTEGLIKDRENLEIRRLLNP